MAGERKPLLTLRCSWSGSANVRGDQTQQVRFQLYGTWVSYRRGGGGPAAREFAVPDPGDADPNNPGNAYGPGYLLAGVRNLVACLQADIDRQSLPYTVSAVRDLGGATATGGASFMGQPVVEFDIEGTWTANFLDLDFQAATTQVPAGWEVVKKLAAIQAVSVQVDVTDALVFGTATGRIQLTATGGTTGIYAYQWADGVTGTIRANLVAGTYECTISDQSGASTVVTVVVGSDPRLVVQVTTTDTSITLVPSGGVAPYAYQWADGPTTAARTGLTTGDYECLVTDAHGASVTVQVSLSAYSFYWSRNAVALALDAGDDFRLDPTTKPNLSFLCEVWVELDYLSGTFVPVGPVLEQPADAGGRTTFEVSALLGAYLDYHVPAVGLTRCQRADSLFRRFFLRHAESFGAPPQAQPSFAVARSYVALGGLSFYEAQARTWFTSYQAQQRPFLTWEPATKAVLLDQPEYLYYMVLDEPDTFTLQLRVLLSDGTEVRLERPGVADVLPHEIFCLPVGYRALGLAALDTADHQVTGWQVWVATVGGTQVLSEVRTYQLNRRRYPHRRYLLFATSLGGMATYAALGEAQLDAEVSGQELSRSLPVGYDPQLGDTEVLSRSLRPVVKLAGGKRTQAQLVASQDLLLSRRVLLQEGGRWQPGYLKAKNSTLLDEGKLVPVQELEFIRPTEQLYTPSLPAAPVLVQAPQVQ